MPTNKQEVSSFRLNGLKKKHLKVIKFINASKVVNPLTQIVKPAKNAL